MKAGIGRACSKTNLQSGKRGWRLPKPIARSPQVAKCPEQSATRETPDRGDRWAAAAEAARQRRSRPSLPGRHAARHREGSKERINQGPATHRTP